MDGDLDGIAPDRLRTWLATEVDPSISAVTGQRLGGGHSSGAWRLDLTVDGGRLEVVLKAPSEPSVVYLRDAGREGRILDGLQRAGAPVPAILAIASDEHAVGRPCFVMELVDGHSVADNSSGGYHDDAGLRAASADEVRVVWETFHDALASVHSVNPALVPDAAVGDGTVQAVLDYWRASLLDAAPKELVPRQLQALDWLAEHCPADADENPAVCLGDARLVNGIIADGQVRALVDFEVAYLGNPAADIGYSLLMDQLHRQGTEDPLALPGAAETWRRWSEKTGRPVTNPAYWTAFGATILCITATRAMTQWGLAGDDPEGANPIVGAWETMIKAAQ
jgi:aminoglycoside phosphotransferase (APT) family kinase protein